MRTPFAVVIIAGCSLLAAASAEEQRGRLKETRKLRAVAVSNPLGLELNEVAFSWSLPSGGGGQTAFQILVATSPVRLAADVGDVWDSGRRYSEEHADIRYGGTALESDTRYWFKVRIWDTDGGPGPFSQPASFTTAKQAAARSIKRSARPIGGKPRFIEGKIGKAIEVGGKSPPIRMADYPQLRPTDGTTICAWIKLAAAADDWQTIFRKEDGSARRLLSIGRTDDVWGLWIGLGIAGRYREFGAAYPKDKLADSRWHHVAGTYDGNHLRLFVDGKQIGERAQTGRLDAGGSAPAYVGCYEGRQEPFRGGIDDVRIYDVALTARQLAQLATENKTDAGDRIVAWLKLDGNLQNEQKNFIELAPRNRVVLLGNTLISRMAKNGYLEAAITSRWPNHDITFRNLGWPADDVFGTARSEFGSATNLGYQTLIRQVEQAKPSTLFVGYGSEAASTETKEDMEQFQIGYAKLLDAIEETGAKLILLSPPRQERFGTVLPDPAERNKRLAKVSAFIGQTARQRGHAFVDLFAKLIPSDPKVRVTENGIHLNRIGYRLMAKTVLSELDIAAGDAVAISFQQDGQLLPSSGARLTAVIKTRRGIRFDLQADRLPDAVLNPSRTIAVAGRHLLKIDGQVHRENSPGPGVATGPEFDQAERLRQLIIEKNRLHRYRIRPLNKTYVFLFRRHEMGHLAYEMEDFDRLVEAKEELIVRVRLPRVHRYEVEHRTAWKAPRKYPDHEVPKNIPAPDTAAELKSFTLAEGFQINLFAKNPMIANPINMNWDSRGRAWVSTSSTYPHIKPGREPNDRIVILEDTDQDGVADKSTVFAEGLLVPHSVMPVQGGAYVCSATEFLFLADRDGDDRADERRIVCFGFGNADVHHMIHGLRWAPWGELYFLQSIYINSFVETPHGNRRLNGSGLWRFRPETERLEVFVRGMVNPWGHALDDWGQSFCTDGAAGNGPHYTFQDAAFRSAVGAARVLSPLIPGKPNNTAAEFVSGRHLPERWHGSLLANDFRAHRTVRYRIKEDRSGYSASEVETVLRSSHRSFRPVDVKMGPDGAIYIVDWYNAIIDHGEVDFHHPLRDKSHGRIWRLTAKHRPLVKRPRIHGATIAQLLSHLKAPEEYTRAQAKRELARRDRTEVLKELSAWLQKLDRADPRAEHHRLEALWLCGSLRSINRELLRRVLSSPDPRGCAAAVRMVSHWSADLPDAADLLAGMVDEDHPRVRLEAVNALRLIGTLKAANLAMRALDQPIDPNLNYALWFTARALQDRWIPTLLSGKPVFDGNVDHVSFALKAAADRRAVQSLVKLIKDQKIKGPDRRSALRMIAGLGGAKELAYVLGIAAGADDLELLSSLADSPAAGRTVPANARLVEGLLSHKDSRMRAVAAQLVAKWKIPIASDVLLRMVDRKQSPLSERHAAAGALAGLGRVDALKRLAAGGPDRASRIAGTLAWSTVDSAGAAGSAAGLLAEVTQRSEAERIVRIYTSRKDAPAHLVKALRGKKLDPAVAIAGIRVAQGSGRDLSALVSARTNAAARNPSESRWTPRGGRSCSATSAKGATSSGEQRYSGAKLPTAPAATPCTAAAATSVPIFSSAGASMTAESILESLLEPSNKIQQGYETAIVVRKDGTIVSGTLQRKSDTALLLRDVTGKIISVPHGDVDEVDTSPISLMPANLTASLRRDELIDLVRYLTTLGKSRG